MTITNYNGNVDLFLPSEYADKIAVEITSAKNKVDRQKLGQFFTPLSTAKKLIEFSEFSITSSEIKICEPACGLCILSCSLIEYLCTLNNIKEIELTCFEIDSSITEYTKEILTKLVEYCNRCEVVLSYTLIEEDFILYYKDVFDNNYFAKTYDLIISNPPFFKLNNYDERVTLAKEILYGLPNIYTIFYYISTKIINNKGLLLFLIPRSICSGSFFKQFRAHFINYIKFDKIHLYSTDEKIFDNHSVLHEFVFIKSSKVEFNNEYSIEITHSENIDSITNIRYKHNFSILKNLIPLATSKKDLEILQKLKTFSTNLGAFGFEVFYSKLVISKVEKLLNSTPCENCLPVIWLHNIEQAKFIFPVEHKYPNYIQNTENIKPFLIYNESCIFFRRYNNNDYITRIVTTAYKNSLNNYNYLAIDRLVGVLLNKSNNLPIETIYGISAYLNSEFVNSYFRMINGIINVTGEMILELPIPDIAVINKMGLNIKNGYNSEIDKLL